MGETEKPKKVTTKVKSWIMDSISSGMSFTHKLHQTFLRVFGVIREETKPTKLERVFATKIDQIVRKGKSPTILFEIDEVWEAFDACRRVFPNETTTIEVKDKKGRKFPQEFNVFRSLHQYAFAIRADEKMIQEHKRVLSEGTGIINRARLQRQIAEAKARNSERLAIFQRIVFAEAEAIENGVKQRLLSIRGKAITLEELVMFMRQRAVQAERKRVDRLKGPLPQAAAGDRPSKEDRPAASAKPMAQSGQGRSPDTPSPAGERDAKSGANASRTTRADKRGTDQDIVEWRKIRRQEEGQDEAFDDSFNLDF